MPKTATPRRKREFHPDSWPTVSPPANLSPEAKKLLEAPQEESLFMPGPEGDLPLTEDKPKAEPAEFRRHNTSRNTRDGRWSRGRR